MVVVEVCGNNSRPLSLFPLLQCLRKVCFFHIITSNVRICLLLCWANPPFSDSIFELFLRQRSTDFFSTVMLLYRSQKVKLLFGSSFSCWEIKNSRFLLYFFFEDHDGSVKLITFLHPIMMFVKKLSIAVSCLLRHIPAEITFFFCFKPRPLL